MNKIIGIVVIASGISVSAGYCANLTPSTQVSWMPRFSITHIIARLGNHIKSDETASQSSETIATIAQGGGPLVNLPSTLFCCECRPHSFLCNFNASTKEGTTYNQNFRPIHIF
jgi:hypothetical protein